MQRHPRTDAIAAFIAPALILSVLYRPLPAQEQSSLTRSAGSRRSPVSAKLVVEARRMVAEFKTTRYTHKTHIDREHGICEVDCSGFVVAILKQVAPEHLKLIDTEHKRPLAEDFYDAVASPDRDAPRAWLRIRRIEDAKPGDLIAWLKLDREAGDNTGQVMLVAEEPVFESQHLARVRILDSTLHGHGHDTRATGTSGIGEGTIWLELDPRGRPIGYRWKSKRGMLHEAPIVVGRPVPIEK